MKIRTVAEQGTGNKLGLGPGDILEAIDGSRVRDIIDYRFRVSAERIVLRVRRGSQVVEHRLDKDVDDDLGLEFEDFRIRKCANDCVFCFVDQNPAGMRKELYFRDGDYRLSFLHGHYITMTNMGWKELRRVVEQRLSPLYLSAHVTDPSQRLEMFLFHKDDFLLEKVDYLTSNDIQLHTQVVLCPGWNDGQLLERTIADLHAFTPGVRSLSIVPVGLTRHREDLPYIEPVSTGYARAQIAHTRELDHRFRHRDGSRFVFLSDEWFLRAGEPLPGWDYYGEFEGLENGVGQVRYFLDTWEEGMRSVVPELTRPTRITIGSGTLIEEIFRDQFISTLDDNPNLEVNYVTIDNDFYGSQVTVSGLLTGGDIVTQLAGRNLGERVVFSDRILNRGRERTLDDMSLDQLSERLGVPVQVTSDDPGDFFSLLRQD